jgi:hypothetical protein
MRGGRDRDAVVLELYDDVAHAWRSLQATSDKRARLDELRRSVRSQFALVKQLEDTPGLCTPHQVGRRGWACTCARGHTPRTRVRTPPCTKQAQVY